MDIDFARGDPSEIFSLGFRPCHVGHQTSYYASRASTIADWDYCRMIRSLHEAAMIESGGNITIQRKESMEGLQPIRGNRGSRTGCECQAMVKLPRFYLSRPKDSHAYVTAS